MGTIFTVQSLTISCDATTLDFKTSAVLTYNKTQCKDYRATANCTA